MGAEGAARPFDGGLAAGWRRWLGGGERGVMRHCGSEAVTLAPPERAEKEAVTRRCFCARASLRRTEKAGGARETGGLGTHIQAPTPWEGKGAGGEAWGRRRDGVRSVGRGEPCLSLVRGCGQGRLRGSKRLHAHFGGWNVWSGTRR